MQAMIANSVTFNLGAKWCCAFFNTQIPLHPCSKPHNARVAANVGGDTLFINLELERVTDESSAE